VKNSPHVLPELRADSSRLLLRLFIAGNEAVGPGDSRAGSVIDRLLALSPAQVQAALDDLARQFPYSLAAIHDAARQHAVQISSRITNYSKLSVELQLLIGAAFTHQSAVEGAALCNPSIVPHPIQDTDLGSSTDARFVLSVRAIGEGHQSSIGFRAGTISATGVVTLDDAKLAPAGNLTTGDLIPGVHHRSVLHALLKAVGHDHQNASFVLDSLPVKFGNPELEKQLVQLDVESITMRNVVATTNHLRDFAHSSYGISFHPNSVLSDRVLWPVAPVERQGLEDARFVRFTADDGSVVFYATYTAFDGTLISQQLLATEDFVTFFMTPMAGSAAVGKGLALFPRTINGQYVALSRSDRETNSIAFSDDLRVWNNSVPLQSPTEVWELLQLGNCGSPIETDAGWLVLTHGVGPMRTYAIGALLLDLHDPRKVIGRSIRPLLQPHVERGGGYVPNVVYTCGAMLHNGHLVIPYGVNDHSITFATMTLDDVLASLSA
jgi:predicted GH43/DUF377 family glycosyl hydrolase